MLDGINQYILNIYHYLLQLRDTVEYTMEREHKVELYNNRKNTIVNGKAKGSALGNFFENNADQSKATIEKLDEIISDFYSDESTIIKVTEAGEVRVDHTQHIKLFQEVVPAQEAIRDILSGYINYARQQNASNDDMLKLVVVDERMTRVILAMLMMREFEKSFFEFQKVMGESKGQPTPQSNYIVSNEISVLAKLIRDSRAKAHCTDNETLDLLDDVNKVIEMTEGRRDRRDNKSFQDLFNDINRRLSDYVAKVEPQWREIFDKLIKEANASQPEKAPEQA